MKKSNLIKIAIVVLMALAALVTRNTDLIYVATTLVFFSICIAYAEWCERL